MTRMVEATARSGWARFARVRGTGPDHGVTTLELFFDLVFVFGFVQVTQLLSDEPTATGALRGLVVFALLWWVWCSYAWLGNQAQADEGTVRLTMLLATGVMFVMALTIPESFVDLPGGLFGPLVFAGCFAAVRLLHLASYLVAAGDDAVLRRQILTTAVPVVLASGLLAVGAALGPPAQTWVWALALVVDYVGIWVTNTAGWRLHSARHFAERFGLVVIVALGESLVSIGVGVAEHAVSWPVILGSAFGITTVVAMWWLYFDVATHVGEHALAHADDAGRSRLAADAYTYLHFPVVGSVLFVALGLKKAMSYVSDPEHHTLSEPLSGMPLLSLYVGAAVYVVGHAAFLRRTGGRWAVPHLVAAAVVPALLPLAARLPALAAMALVAAVLVGLVVVDLSRLGPARDRIRHGHAPAPAT